MPQTVLPSHPIPATKKNSDLEIELVTLTTLCFEQSDTLPLELNHGWLLQPSQWTGASLSVDPCGFKGHEPCLFLSRMYVG